jgi:hypothetical protein
MSSIPPLSSRQVLSAWCRLAWVAVACAGCTWHHSKQALFVPSSSEAPPPADARFVTEEDSGLSIFGMFVLAEPDHYAVLLERMRRDYRCERLLYPQLDFYTDHWLLIAFPISRVTSLCVPEAPLVLSPVPAQEQVPPGISGPAVPASPAVPPTAYPPPAAPSTP